MPDFNLTSTKHMYNEVKGNKAEFVKKFEATYNTKNPYEAEKWFNYMASMDTDGNVGISDREHQIGLIEKRELAEIKRDNLYSRYVSKEDSEKFDAMSQAEKFLYIVSKIPHEKGREAEAHIQASIVLTTLNRLSDEMILIDEALSKYADKDDTSEVKTGTPIGNEFMKSYLDEEKLAKFNTLKGEEQVEFLKNNLSHTPGTTDEELKASAKRIVEQKERLEKQAKNTEEMTTRIANYEKLQQEKFNEELIKEQKQYYEEEMRQKREDKIKNFNGLG